MPLTDVNKIKTTTRLGLARVLCPSDLSLALILLFVFNGLVFANTFYQLVGYWLSSPEYGHGLLVSGLAFYLLWCRRNLVSHLRLTPNPLGLLCFALCMLLYLVGLLGDIDVAIYYALVLSLASIALSVGGGRLVRAIFFPLVLLFLSVPLHPYLQSKLTADLQLLSSNIGVWLIRLMGLPALQEGNVINMGSFLLLVEEACSGLRFLFPLCCVSLIAGYYYLGNKVVRVAIFLSAVPITVFMNSLRIAITGVLIKYFGEDIADGFLHDLEGWLVFVLSCGVLGGVLAVITLIRGKSLRIKDNFLLVDSYNPGPVDNSRLLKRYYVMLAVIGFSGILVNGVWFFKAEVVPKKTAFYQMPLSVADRDFYPDTIEHRIANILNADDYYIGDFIDHAKPPINVYMAYYESQKEGSLIHSPEKCIPAGGWKILSKEFVNLKSFGFDGTGNRMIIEKNTHKLLVYYWVNQQGKSLAADSDIYKRLIMRSVLSGRTDATLIRLFVPIQQLEVQEREIREFSLRFRNVVTDYLPY